VGNRSSALGDQDKDKGVPGAAHSPASAATFAAFAAEASERDDVRAAAVLASSSGARLGLLPTTGADSNSIGSKGAAAEPKPSAAAAAAAFTAAAAAATAAAVGGGMHGYADAVKQSSPGSAGKGSAGKSKMSKSASKGEKEMAFFQHSMWVTGEFLVHVQTATTRQQLPVLTVLSCAVLCCVVLCSAAPLEGLMEVAVCCYAQPKKVVYQQ
jgi:hypothetical protein